MPDRFFLDTNILLYSFDTRDRSKQETALTLVERALAEQAGVISFQVVQEFLNVAVQKWEHLLPAWECKAYLEKVLDPLCEILPGKVLYESALDVREETGFRFYDSLIVAAAVQAGCKILYSEDLQAGRQISGLTIQNPF